jgi:hypothetical protein
MKYLEQDWTVTILVAANATYHTTQRDAKHQVTHLPSDAQQRHNKRD